MMRHINIVDLQWDVKKALKSLDLPESLLPVFGTKESIVPDGIPLIYYESSEYVFLIYERGTILKEKKTPEKDEIFFWVLDEITFMPAFKSAAKDCQESEQRICAFKKQIEYLYKADVAHRFIRELKQKYNTLVGFDIF